MLYLSQNDVDVVKKSLYLQLPEKNILAMAVVLGSSP